MKRFCEIETVYASDDDITFIMETYYEDDRVQDRGVVGFYYGEPSEVKTRNFFLYGNKIQKQSYRVRKGQ